MAQAAGHILSGHGQLILFHRRQDTQVPLDTAGVVVVDIAVDHLDEGQLVSKAPALVALPLQDAPEALHWAVVNAVCYP